MATSVMPETKPLESRAEVDSLEALQHRRRNLMKEYAPLAAKFKGGAVAGTDAARKRHRALVAKRILIELKQEFDKNPPMVPIKKGSDVMVRDTYTPPAENALERMANADTEHIKFCDQLEADYRRFILLENDIQEINEKIRSREVELYSYNAELRMQS